MSKSPKTCTACNKPASPRHAGKCQNCWTYFRRGGRVHPLPPNGTIHYDENGDPICHICGRSYHKLMSHVWQVHGVHAHEYKKEFGLYTTHSVMNETNKETISRQTQSRLDMIRENLVLRGQGTRFKPGSKGRTKEQVPLQHKLDNPLKKLKGGTTHEK